MIGRRSLNGLATVLTMTVMTIVAPGTHLYAQNLGAVMTGIASAWARGDADAVTALADKQGISLEIEGTHVGAISPRQASAVLRRVFDESRTIRASAGTARLLPGTDARGFGEILWERRSRGTTEVESIKVFIALMRVGDSWRITEIRVMQ